MQRGPPVHVKSVSVQNSNQWSVPYVVQQISLLARGRSRPQQKSNRKRGITTDVPQIAETEPTSITARRITIAFATCIVLDRWGPRYTDTYQVLHALRQLPSIRLEESTVASAFGAGEICQINCTACANWLLKESTDRILSCFYGEHFCGFGDYLDEDKGSANLTRFFPFQDFHALEVCYVGSGCDMVGKTQNLWNLSEFCQSPKASHLRSWEEVRLSEQLYGESYLFYAEFDREGEDAWRLGSRLTGSLPARNWPIP